MNPKFLKLLKSLKRTEKFSICGDDAIRKALAIDKKAVLVETKGRNTIFKRTVFSPVKYGDLVSMMIRTEYTQDQEFAILRQRDEKKEDFDKYFEFAEMCKREAKGFIAERNQYYGIEED